MRHHDRGEFQFFCYSDFANSDAVTETLKQFSDHWRQTVGFSHARLCEAIRQDRIDILFDLTLHMSNNRLLAFAAKPAPVQMTWAGYPGTTGLEAIDYRLTDPYLDPPGQFDEFYAEKSLRLPATFWSLDLATLEDLHTPAVNSLPAVQGEYVTFGCLNNFSKVNQRVLRLWGRVLDAVPKSRMVLLTPPGSAREWVRQSLGDRVEFVARLPHDAYLQVKHQIDIGLDTVPYNGHMTSLDSLWMGVPIVTLPGNTVVGRGGKSILRNLAMDDLIAASEDDFVRIAASLAGDLARVGALRTSLRERMRASPILDGARFASDFQAILRQAWKTWCG
jgi:predicted O-linked N-acetylglucosamine transferase (SPINDLY family)